MIFDYDKYSLILDNQRLVIRSAALHYFRLPGRNMWKDRLSKLKNCGYNTVDLYFNWGYHSNQPGIYDFTDIKDIRELLNLTEELGLFVIARPGPYINAEISAGGLPLWLFNIPDIVIRNRQDGEFIYSPPYMKAVKEWYSRLIPMINEYQNVIAFQIENEYSTHGGEPDYIQELYDYVRELGVKVPIFHNDAYCACLYSDIVNIYGFDTYPTINMNYDWRNNPYTFGTLDYAEENLKPCAEESPLYIAELQAGWFDKWRGYGYDHIRKLFGREHINIVTKTALANGITMFNHYMGCGGTSWGTLASAEVYTSYDFAAPVSENSLPNENYYKAKEINYFLHSFNFASTDLISLESDILGHEEENIFARLRKDNINNCEWLFLRNMNQDNKRIQVLGKYDLTVKSFDMKILPVNLELKGCKLLFSSASLFGRICKDNLEVIFVILENNEELLISDFDRFEDNKQLNIVERDNTLSFKLKDEPENDFERIKFIRGDKTTEFILLSQKTADKTWLFEDKAIIGPDFIFDDPYKAAFSSNTNVININLDAEMKIKHVKSPETKQFESPDLKDWGIYSASPQLDNDFDYSGWNICDNKLDCLSNSVPEEFIWYKGLYTNVINQIEISAKHCYAIYINEKRVYSHESLHYDHGKEIEELITVDLPKIQNKDKNEITVLVQNLGFDKGFENYPGLSRGILKLKTVPSKEIEWRIKGGLTPEIEEWDYVSIDNLDDSSQNSHIIYMTAEFDYHIPENTYAPLELNMDNCSIEKANICLNGKLIGRWWKSFSPESKFYLPEGFLKSKNRLSLIIWQLNNYHKIDDYKSIMNNVNINIRDISSYSVCDLKTLM